VAGISTQLGEEKVVAWIVAEGGVNLPESQIREHCLKSLAAYKIPQEIIFLDRIPRTSVGKISRRQLVEKYFEKRP